MSIDYKKCLKEGTKVTDVRGEFSGEIVGVASTEMPVIGFMYVIKITNRRSKNWVDYPYSCACLPQSLIFPLFDQVNQPNRGRGHSGKQRR